MAPELILEPRSKTVGADQFIDVDVFVREVVDLRAYQVAVSATPVGRGTPLELDSIRMERDRRDYVFGRREVIDAVDFTGGRAGGLSVADGVDAIDRRYLATFRFHVSQDDPDEFDVAIDFDESFLLSSTGAMMSAQAGTAVRITVNPR